MMNNIVRALRSALGAAVILSGSFFLSGCVQTEGLEVIEDDVTVTLRLDEALMETAYVRLNHDGAQDDCWYYMITEDLYSDAKPMLEAELKADLDADGKISANVGTNKNLTFENLAAKKQYRVIAARILVNGVITGNVAELVFITQRNPDVFEAHPQWKVEYKERRVNKDDVNDETEIFMCTVADTTQTYVACLLSKEDFTKTYSDSLRACFEGYVEFRNSEHVKWPNVVKNKSGEHVEDRLRAGDYIVFMIGIDSTGVLTGDYARQDFSLKQEVATDAYRRWIGNWEVVGTHAGEELRYPVEITSDENNLYYRMSGWEGPSANSYFKTVPTELPILLYFEKSTGDAYVVSEELADLADPTLAEFYDFYIYGCVEIDYNGIPTEVPVDVPNVKVAQFTLKNDNRADVTPEIFSFDLNGVHYDAPFLYFNYSYISAMYAGLVPVTNDSKVPRIETMRLERK